MSNHILADKTILLVNTGSIKKKFIIQRLKKLGLKIIVLNKEVTPWAASLVENWILADNTNHSEAIQAVKDFLTNNPSAKIDGILTFWEDDVLLTARLVDRFGFIGISHNIAKKARNKFWFREFCESHSLPTPRYKLIRKTEDLEDIRQNFMFPVVIKPAYGSSSAYVTKINAPEDLAEIYDNIKSSISINSETALNDGLDILVEEFIDGDEVDIDILMQNGKVKFYSLSDNFNKSKGIYFVDSGQAIPSTLPEKNQEDLLETAEIILEKMGIQNGCIHFEAKYATNGVYPIEVNLRMGGDYVYSYNLSAWGVDLIEYAAKIALGVYFPKIKKPSVPKKYIIGWDLHPDESGVLVELSSLDNLKKNPLVEEVDIYKTIGDPILVPPEGFEHLGWLTVTGQNTLDAKDNLQDILKTIDYKVVKFDPESFLGKTERKNRFAPAVLNKNLLIRKAKIAGIRQTDTLDLRRLKIGILANIYPRSKDPISQKQNAISQKINASLTSLGYQTTLINFANLSEATEILKKGDIDLVLNLGEKPQSAALLESFQMPYIGSDLYTLALASDKINFKKIMSFNNLPIPDWDYAYELNDKISTNLTYPLLVKPALSDHCLGVTQESVVNNPEELQRELKKIIVNLKQPAIVEEYIAGDEYQIYILGNDQMNLRVLPLARTIFDGLTDKAWHINTYESRWLNKNGEKIISQLPAKNISKKLESLITEIALDTYNILDCKDYGKVEIKIDSKGNPYVLELSPYPWLDDTDPQSIIAAATLAGLDFHKLLEEIIRLATSRYKNILKK